MENETNSKRGKPLISKKSLICEDIHILEAAVSVLVPKFPAVYLLDWELRPTTSEFMQ